MSHLTNTITQTSRRAAVMSGSALLLVVLALSLLIATHQPRAGHANAPAASSSVSSDTSASVRLPGRLNYQSEHSVCAAPPTADDEASASGRLPGRVAFRQLYVTSQC